MSVVNVYDSSISDRVYRKGLSHEEACKVILDGRGTMFDPLIVDVFYKIRDRFIPLSKTANTNSGNLRMELL
jgi:HD-GYP domain-containing protein (c-di-GMP phosphodiesterase class II)